MGSCTKGKSCKSTCIYRDKECRVVLNPGLGIGLGRMARMVRKEISPLSDPKKLSQWLLDNKEELASWGMTKSDVELIIRDKPSYITVGVEPYANYNLENLARVFNSKGGIFNKIKGVVPEGDSFENLTFRANYYRYISELVKIQERTSPDSSAIEKYRRAVAYMDRGGDVKKTKAGLEEEGDVNKGNLEGLIKVWDKNSKNSLQWSGINLEIMKSAGLEGKGAFPINVSGLPKPSTTGDYNNSFGRLIKSQGMDPGPYKNSSTWYKFSAEQKLGNLDKIITEAKPKLIYVGGKDSSVMFEALSGSGKYGSVNQVEVEGFSSKGSYKKSKLEYLVVDHGLGDKTVIIKGPHTGAMGMGSNIGLVRSIGGKAKELLS